MQSQAPVQEQVPAPTLKTRPRRRVKKNDSESNSGWRIIKFDYPLFFITIVLCVFGLAMLLSASYFVAYREYGDTYHFFRNQLVFVGIGFTAMIAISLVNYELLMKRWVLLLLGGGSLAMMLAVRLGAGVTQGGAERWINLGFVTFQPSEILKFAMIVMLAWVVHRNPEQIKTKEGFFRVAAIVGLACGLTVIQPHLSGTVIMFLIGVTLMCVGGVRWYWFVAMFTGIAAVIPFVPAIMKFFNFTYSDARFLSWRDPFADTTDKTFQTFQSLVSIGSGGLFGLGLGNSRQKFSFLPAAQNDFIFSVIVEELGFIGGALVLLLFVAFVLRGFYIAKCATDRFGMMLAVGITVQIGIQAFLNIAVATNTIPNTGVSLPLFSYGGTAIVMQLAQIGVLLNISRKARIE